MTRETAQKLLPLIQAFSEGKEIQYEIAPDEWRLTPTPSWQDGTGYRIKPREPREFTIYVHDNHITASKTGHPYKEVRVIEILTDETP